jgi:DNA repair protein RadC
MLELIMFRAIPRRDIKPMAKDLIKKFGDLSGVLSADRDLLREVKGISENVVTELKIVESAAKKVGQSQIIRRQALKSWDDLVTYCRTAMAEKQIDEISKSLGIVLHDHLIIARGSEYSFKSEGLL